MAYKPYETPLEKIARKHGWRACSGLEALAAQAVFQAEFFTGVRPLFSDALVSVREIDIYVLDGLAANIVTLDPALLSDLRHAVVIAQPVRTYADQKLSRI